MGLTLAERRAIIETTAARYQRASKSAKGRILDELCANTGWHRSHARKALAGALRPKVAPPRKPRPVKYGPDVIAALTVCWTVLGMPAGKRLAPMLGELVPVLRHFAELVIDDETASLLVSISAATIDRRLGAARAKYQLKGRCTTKPGSLLKSQIPVRTWADWNDARPGFVEIDLVSHDGGNLTGAHAFTLTVTDIATGWTENRSVPKKTANCVLAALNDIAYRMPFPVLGVDSDNGSEFINLTVLQWCERHHLTFTRARPGNKNDGCHAEQKNWAVVRTVVGYHRYDTAAELLLLNEIWKLQSKLTNYFYPQQKLISKVRHGAKVTKKYDTAATPFHRAIDHPTINEDQIAALARTHAQINPAATRRRIQALAGQLLTMNRPGESGDFLI
ncbi:integrase catalytic domain-containing protein [Mycolicibacterium pallens]|uniref:DDE-type integrase/transposase/recombinase n=1 Tax=Mycolicibacterium pallens TaxID=370524 RepID=A0ABX8VGK3_9MYCO|nr:DDE-type integrase/transposase/recombinase [Mycolicibacterium pallens]